MAASLRQAGNVSTSNATLNLSADTPSQTVNGDVEILILWFNDKTGVLTPPAGWTLVPNSRVNHSTLTLATAMYYHVALNEGPTITVTSNVNQAYTGMILTYRSDAATVPVDGLASLENALAGTQITCPEVSALYAPEPLVLSVGNLQNATFTGPTGFVERQDASTPAGALSAAVYTGIGFAKGIQPPQAVVSTVAGAALGLQFSIGPSRVLTEQTFPLTILDIVSFPLVVTG